MAEVLEYAAPIGAFLLFYALLRRRGAIEAASPAWRDPQVVGLLGAILGVFLIATAADRSPFDRSTVAQVVFFVLLALCVGLTALSVAMRMRGDR